MKEKSDVQQFIMEANCIPLKEVFARLDTLNVFAFLQKAQATLELSFAKPFYEHELRRLLQFAIVATDKIRKLTDREIQKHFEFMFKSNGGLNMPHLDRETMNSLFFESVLTTWLHDFVANDLAGNDLHFINPDKFCVQNPSQN